MTAVLVEFGVLVVALATLASAHATLAIGLARRTPRWRGPVAFLVAPLAPWWGWQARMRVRGVVWVASALVYGVTLGVWLRG
jgi:hypothetical protein